MDVAEAKVVEAAPGLHARRVEAERADAMSPSRTDEFGLRTVIARIQAGDAVWIKATVDRVAEIIAPRHPARSCGRGPPDRLRPARPPRRAARAAARAQRAEPRRRGRGGPTARLNGVPCRPPRCPAPPTSPPLSPPACSTSTCTSALGGGSAVAPGSEGSDPVPLLMRLLGPHPAGRQARSATSPTGSGPPPTSTPRRSRSGPPDHRRRLLALRHLHHPPGRPRPPPSLRRPRPPGRQTGVHNSGPLGRRHHRWKTHAGFRARQSGLRALRLDHPARLGFLVDHTAPGASTPPTRGCSSTHRPAWTSIRSRHSGLDERPVLADDEEYAPKRPRLAHGHRRHPAHSSRPAPHP